MIYIYVNICIHTCKKKINMRVGLTEDGDEVRLQQVDHRLEPDRPLGAPGQLAVAAVEGLGPELPQHGLHHLQDVTNS